MANGFTKIINESFDNYIKRLIESEDGREECKEEILDESADISEYQKWVDFDMKKYGKISGVTMNKIKKAGFSVVKDQYGDYEVIADRRDESCKDEAYRTHKRKSMREAAPKKASTDHKWGDKSVKSQLALPENQKTLNDMMKSGRNWQDMKNDFIQLIQSLDCTDKNKKQTIMKINGIKNKNAFYSTVATYLTGIKAESLSKKRSLDEAVPKDLMRQIKRTDGYGYRGSQRWQDGKYTNDYDLDYANAEPEELTVTDVMRMKRNGEDLSDIWVTIPGKYRGHELIRLDKLGNPDQDFSTDSPRANQALKTTLAKADKIYRGNIKPVSDTQPEKWKERTSDPGRRSANAALGSKRGNLHREWGKRFHKDLEKHNQSIAQAKREYEDGDISRKEMEDRIARAKARRYGSIDVGDFNLDKNRQANARYYDSNKTNKLGDLKDAKERLAYAQANLDRDKAALERAKAGQGFNNTYHTKKVAEIEQKIAQLQVELEYQKSKLAEDPAQQDIKSAQRGIDAATAEIERNQKTIDTLLKRNK